MGLQAWNQGWFAFTMRAHNEANMICGERAFEAETPGEAFKAAADAWPRARSLSILHITPATPTVEYLKRYAYDPHGGTFGDPDYAPSYMKLRICHKSLTGLQLEAHFLNELYYAKNIDSDFMMLTIGTKAEYLDQLLAELIAHWPEGAYPVRRP